MVENLVCSNTDSLAGEEKKVVVVSIVSIFDQSVIDPLLQYPRTEKMSKQALSQKDQRLDGLGSHEEHRMRHGWDNGRPVGKRLV